MQHNIWKGNHDFEAFRRVVEAQKPDVIVMQETQPFHKAWFERLRAQYPYQADCDGDRSCAVTVVSRYPLEASPQVDPENDLVMRAVITIGTHKLVLLGTYIVTPFPGQRQDWEFSGLVRIMAAQPPNAVLAGDFNSVFWSPNMTRFIRGSGVCSTNPGHATFPRRLGPFGLPIDHIFLKPGVRLLDVATVGGTGSDHQALVATVSIP
jgi:endonuclease/exonuclease/phosphatase (EEP) superfamily protein YafD